MTFSLLAPLVGLALVDSTSFGTLLIPVWFLLAPGRIRRSRVLVYLGTLATAYWLLGVLLSLGALTVLDDVSAWADSTAGRRLELAVGVALLGIAILTPVRRDGGHASARVVRWRDRAMGVGSSGGGVGSLMVLALTAFAVEAASMVPYLGAVGMLSTSDLPPAGQGAVLAAYCLVMVLPALALLVARTTMGDRAQAILRRVAAWLERQSGEAVLWILALVGVLLVRDAFGGSPAPGWIPGLP